MKYFKPKVYLYVGIYLVASSELLCMVETYVSMVVQLLSFYSKCYATQK